MPKSPRVGGGGSRRKPPPRDIVEKLKAPSRQSAFLAFAMGRHRRLGLNSGARDVGQDVMQMLLQLVWLTRPLPEGKGCYPELLGLKGFACALVFFASVLE